MGFDLGDLGRAITKNTTDKWIKPEHKDALESLLPILATAGMIPGLDLGGILGNLSTTTGIPQSALMGALQDPKNPLSGFVTGGLGQFGGDAGKLLNHPLGQAAAQYATGNQAGALTSAMGMLPLVGDYFKGEGKNLLSNLLPAGANSVGDWGSILSQLPGDVGETFKNNQWLGQLAQQFLGGNFLGGLNAPNMDLGGLGDFGNLINKLMPESNQIKEFMNTYGIPIGLGYLGKEEAQPWRNKVESSIVGQEQLGNQYMQPYNQMFSPMSGQSPFELAGYAPNTGQSMTGDFVNKMVSELTAQQGGTPQAGQGAQGAQTPAYDVMTALMLKKAMGTGKGDANYNPDADLNKDNMVDVQDFLTMKKNFGGGAGAVGAQGGPSMQAAGKQYAGGTRGFSESGQGGKGAAADGGEGVAIGPNGAPIMKLKKDMTPFELAISAEMERAINGMNTDSARLQRNYMMENVDKNQIAAARALDEASTGRGMMPGASSGTRIRNLQDLLGQSLGQKNEIDRGLFIQGEDTKKAAQQNLLNTAMSMMGMPLSAAQNQASIGGQSGQMAKDIYDMYGQLAQAIAYAQANKQNQGVNVNLPNVWGQPAPTTPGTPAPAPAPTVPGTPPIVGPTGPGGGGTTAPGGGGGYGGGGTTGGGSAPPSQPTAPGGGGAATAPNPLQPLIDAFNNAGAFSQPSAPPAQNDIPIPSLEGQAPAPQQQGPYTIEGELGTGSPIQGAGQPAPAPIQQAPGGYQQSEFMRQAPRTSMGGAQQQPTAGIQGGPASDFAPGGRWGPPAQQQPMPQYPGMWGDPNLEQPQQGQYNQLADAIKNAGGGIPDPFRDTPQARQRYNDMVNQTGDYAPRQPLTQVPMGTPQVVNQGPAGQMQNTGLPGSFQQQPGQQVAGGTPGFDFRGQQQPGNMGPVGQLPPMGQISSGANSQRIQQLQDYIRFNSGRGGDVSRQQAELDSLLSQNPFGQKPQQPSAPQGQPPMMPPQGMIPPNGQPQQPNQFATLEDWYSTVPGVNGYKPSLNMWNNFQNGQGTNSTNMRLDTFNNALNQNNAMPSYLKEQADMLRSPIANTSMNQPPKLGSMLSSRTQNNWMTPNLKPKGRLGFGF